MWIRKLLLLLRSICFVLCSKLPEVKMPGVRQSHIPMTRKTGYREFGRDSSRLDLRRAQRLLQSGVCEHVYIDMGTNIGIQIRKLYEPQNYPLAEATKIFKQQFKCTDNCYNVCTFGFEPNPTWTSRLKAIDAAYNAVNFSNVIFTETAVANYTGNISFYLDALADKKYHEWGSSTVPWHNSMMKGTTPKVTVAALNIATFLSREVYRRRGRTASSKVVAKMDVEGAEWFLLPFLLQNRVLCGIDILFPELHQWFVKGVPKVNEFITALTWVFAATPGCKTHLLRIDDESYGEGEDTQPLPVAGTTVS